MSNYLSLAAQNSTLPWSWSGKKILELGSGLGLLSITLLCLGANVLSTDGEELVVRQLEINVLSNVDEIFYSNFKSAVFEWGSNVQKISSLNDGKLFDFIVATDVIYGEDRTVWDLLIRSLLALSSTETILLFGQTSRYSHLERIFYKRLENYFDKIYSQNISGETIDNFGNTIQSNTYLFGYRLKL